MDACYFSYKVDTITFLHLILLKLLLLHEHLEKSSFVGFFARFECCNIVNDCQQNFI